MREKLSRLLNVRSGERGLVLSLLLILVLNTLVLELSDVVATAGFVSRIGVSGILWLWVVDMFVTLLAAGGYALIVDRMPRVRLMSYLSGGLALVYIALQLLFNYGAPDWLTYPALYIIADLQFSIFPLAFWTLASDVYTISEAKRLFPIIGAGYPLGSIIGNALPAGAAIVAARWGGSVSQLLALGAVILLSSVVLLRLTFRNRTVRARQSRQSETNVREMIRAGIDFFRNVPLFYYLAIAMLLVGLSLTIVEYHLLFTAEQTFASDLQFQTFYGTYKAALIAMILLVQWLVAGRLLKRVPLKGAFIVLPTTLVIAAGCALTVPDLIGAAIGRFAARLVQRAWDEPSRKAAQGLVPDERRGRISTFLDSYLYSLATIVGCLILGILVMVSASGWLSERVMIAVYLAIAALAAVGAVWAGLQLRAVYEKSLFDWRLSRPRRKSVLDEIEF
jgi:ATP/ADP translocase